MSDLIDRAAAIDALYHVDEYNGRSVEAIRNLPSAQPERTEERTETHACDCIERQAAIDALGKDVMGGLNYKRILNSLPPAQPYTDAEIQKMQELEQAELQKAYECGRASTQPEIIRCKDCKHYEGGWYCSAWNNSPGFPIVTEEGYCNLAERRTDERNEIHSDF